MKANVFWLFLSIILLAPAFAEPVEQNPCEYFFTALKAVPNEMLFRAHGELASVHDGSPFYGCEVRFATNDALLSGNKSVPDFCAGEGTALYRDGWRSNLSYGADGPGTRLHAIEKGDWLCLVSSARPASIEAPYIDGRGTLFQSETLTVVVQCRKK